MRDNLAPLTPVERHGNTWLKRDDLFCVAGVRGGKVRACWTLAQGARGLVTASSRFSPQQLIVAAVAQRLGIPAVVHQAAGPETEEMSRARAMGAEIIGHRPGHNSVVCARARDDALARAWTEIPFGMQSHVTVEETAKQVVNLPERSEGVSRIVVPVGSGIALSGILTGLVKYRQDLVETRILGVMVGPDRTKILDKYAPHMWRMQFRVRLVRAAMSYHEPLERAGLYDVLLDPYYEAKAALHVDPHGRDLFWIVGIR